jgi:hypothetical protein
MHANQTARVSRKLNEKADAEIHAGPRVETPRVLQDFFFALTLVSMPLDIAFKPSNPSDA